MGILFRDAAAIEKLSHVDTIVFDKTGTLTMAGPEVTDIVPLSPISANELLHLAASAEYESGHPLGEAIIRRAREESISLAPVVGLEAFPGRGLKAVIQNRTIILGNEEMMREYQIDITRLEGKATMLQEEGRAVALLAMDGEAIGLIGITSSLRPEAEQVVMDLRHLGFTIIMLTGDNQLAAQATGNKLGVDKVFANVTPLEKLSIIKGLQKEGRILAMVGDGINDAPALAQADIGIAIGNGTAIAIETADVVLPSSNLSGVTGVVLLGKNTMKIIRQNLFWAFFYNASLIPVAAGALYFVFGATGVPSGLSFVLGEYGFLNPVVAAIAMALSSITVLGNSLRLQSIRDTRLMEKDSEYTVGKTSCAGYTGYNN